MKADLLRLLPAFIAIVAVATALAWFTERPQPAPSFTLDIAAGPDAGDRISLDGLAGEVVVLEFWASWCSACRRSVPAMNAFGERYGDRVRLFGVTSEALGPARLVAAHEEFGFDFSTLRDDRGIAQALGVEALPTYIVIDGEGRVRYHHTGTPSEDELAQIVDGLLSEGDDS